MAAKRGRPAGKAVPMAWPPVPLLGLRARRLAAGVSQETAGQWLGCNKAMYGKLELGTVRLDICRARVLAQRLGCNIESLF